MSSGSTEQKFTLSADSVLDWLAKLRKNDKVPVVLLPMALFIEGLRGRRLEIIIRAVQDPGKSA